jgi:hypothetical protein
MSLFFFQELEELAELGELLRGEWRAVTEDRPLSPPRILGTRAPKVFSCLSALLHAQRCASCKVVRLPFATPSN